MEHFHLYTNPAIIDSSRPLSYEYVLDTIFKKLPLIFEKYRDILLDTANVGAANCDETPKDFVALTMRIIDMLKKHAEKSALFAEIFKNARMDFWHGLNEKKSEARSETLYRRSNR